MDFSTLLNAPQYEAVCHTEGPLLVLAGAGSGKTRVLTYRIANLIENEGIDPWHILALTFTNKAANEMRERVDDLVGSIASNMWVSTFHSACVRILRRYIDKLGYEKDFSIYDTSDQKTLIKDVLKALNIDSKTYKDSYVISCISSAKDKLITPEQMQNEAGSDYEAKTIAKIYNRYQQELKGNNALDFDDIIFKTVELFKTNPDVLSYYQNRFRYILVDEYQDTNHAQFVLISLLASYVDEWGDVHHNLCVVGDDDQSIYRFRGADVSNILDFEDQYPDTKTVRLEQNYRSTKAILNCANEVIRHNCFRKSKKLWTDNEEGKPVSFIQYENSQLEAVGVVSSIKSKRYSEGLSLNDFAILYRTNSQSRQLEEELVKQNIPYKIIGGQNFYGRKEIKDILAYLKVLVNPDDDIQVKRIINVPKRGIGATTIGRLTEYCQDNNISFYTALAHASSIPGIGRSVDKLEHFVALIEVFRSKAGAADCSIEDLVNELLETTGYTKELEEEKTVEANTRLEYIEEFVNKVIAYEEENPGATLSEFLEEVSLVADIDGYDESDELVVLMTLHGSKGLEFPHVYITGMEDGLFPSWRSIDSGEPEDIDEERRLCYVGITRARQELTLTCAKLRMVNGQTMYSKPSRFIYDIPRHLLSYVNGDSPTKMRFEKNAGGSSSSRFDGSGFGSGKTSSFGNSYGSGSSYSHDSSTPRFSNKKKNEYAAGDLFGNNPMISKGFSQISSISYSDKNKSNGNNNSTAIDYTTGDTVKHMTFGTGTITAMDKKDSDYIVTVNFEKVGVKKMKASFAKLKKL